MWTIFKKEVYRVLSDRRLVLMIFIVPGLSIYVMYSLMGNVISNQIEEIEQHTIILYHDNMPSTLETMITSIDPSGNQVINVEVTEEALDQDTIDEKLLEGSIDIYLAFDDNFETSIDDYETASPPTMDAYYNQGREESSYAYNQINAVIAQYRELKLIDRLERSEDYLVFNYDTNLVVDERKMAGEGLATLMPMLIVIFLFAGAMSIGPDAIAGEKERGTIATLLITPIKRSEIATGKVVSLAVLSLISALSSFIGIMASLPALMQMDNASDLNIYGIGEYLSILGVLMATVLFIVSLIAVISAYAKTIKEASMFIMPFYFITIIIGILQSFGGGGETAVWLNIVPFYGPVNLLTKIFTFEFSVVAFILVLISNLVYTAVLVYILNLMFKNEKIMFQK
ncbi:MAG: ABC transporter permease [Candidatus Izemoplasmataceae bacterium]